MRPWNIEECKAYAQQLRDKTRASTAEHAAQAIEYLLGLAQPEQDEMLDEGYHCVICGRFLPADEDGVIVHDDIPHPPDMTFDEEENPQ